MQTVCDENMKHEVYRIMDFDLESAEGNLGFLSKYDHEITRRL